jgi:hypothetical protein
MALYGTEKGTIKGINELRYHLLVKMSTKSKFSLSRLPPTLDAASTEHSSKFSAGWETVWTHFDGGGNEKVSDSPPFQ